MVHIDSGINESIQLYFAKNLDVKPIIKTLLIKQ